MSSTYTFEGLAAAAASSNTIAEAVRKLGREPSPKRNEYVMGLMRRFDIDTSHFASRTRRLYTREMLEEAAAQSSSIVEVVRRLGAKEVGGTQAHIGRLLRRYEIDISHFESLRRQPRRRIEEISPAELADAIGHARSIAQVSRILGVTDNTTFRRRYRYQVMKQEIDVSHLLGQAHSSGTRGNSRRPAAEILIADPTSRKRAKTTQLRAALIEVGTPYNCALCGNGPTWQGHQITLEIDHISGDITDNRQQNLRFLCPNCHATTPTFCRKKQHEAVALDGPDRSR